MTTGCRTTPGTRRFSRTLRRKVVQSSLLLTLLGLVVVACCYARQRHTSHRKDTVQTAAMLGDDIETITPRPVCPAEGCQIVYSAGLLNGPVSVVPWKDNRHLICNYVSIQEVDVQTGAHTLVRPDPKPSVWCPSGLFAIPAEQLLFVANYKGHDVLEMQRTGDTLKVLTRYTHADMVSPEGVAVSDDGSLVAVADYDGNAVFVFHRDGRLAWRRHVGLGHGVSFGPGFVVATSLQNRSIIKFDLQGNLLSQAGHLGWGENGYLWPTTIIVKGDDIVISDAHTGKVTFLDHDLRARKSLGGNGPGTGLFNMPYGVVGWSGGWIICDTFKGRLLVLDQDCRCQRILQRQLPGIPKQGWADAPVSQQKFRGYTNLTRAYSFRLPGLPSDEWYPSYDSFVNQSAKPNRILTACRRDFVFFKASFTNEWATGMPYFCWCIPVRHAGKEYMCLGSCQAPFYLIFNEQGWCFPGRMSELCWVVDNALYANSGRPMDIGERLGRAEEAFRQYRQLSENGVDPLEAIRTVYFPKLNKDALVAECTTSFVSKPGRRFWTAWQAAADSAQRQAAAATFDAAVQNDQILFLEEYCLRRLLVPRQ